jgi:hypothetical protein
MCLWYGRLSPDDGGKALCDLLASSTLDTREDSPVSLAFNTWLWRWLAHGGSNHLEESLLDLLHS